MAKTLMIYREFWCISQIFPTLFSQLISIFMIHTFSMGVKTNARLPRSKRFASIAFFPPPVAHADVVEPLKWEWSCFEHYEFVDFFNPGAPPFFFNGSNMPALT